MSDSDQLRTDFPQAAARSRPSRDAQSAQRTAHPWPGLSFDRTSHDFLAEIPAAPLPSAGTGVLTTSGEMRPLEEMESEIIRFAISHYRGQMSKSHAG
jgi:hypothetical protein